MSCRVSFSSDSSSSPYMSFVSLRTVCTVRGEFITSLVYSSVLFADVQCNVHIDGAQTRVSTDMNAAFFSQSVIGLYSLSNFVSCVHLPQHFREATIIIFARRRLSPLVFCCLRSTFSQVTRTCPCAAPAPSIRKCVRVNHIHPLMGEDPELYPQAP